MDSKSETAMTEDDNKWEIEEDARTLKRAEEIKADSKRFDKAKKHLVGELQAITSIAELKERRQTLAKEKDGDES